MVRAKAHVEARGGKTTIPHAFSLMTPKAVLEDCLGCHARDFNRANIRRSEHTLHDVACTSCHSIHHSATPKYLLAKQQREMCYTLPRHHPRAVRDALQASRQRRLHGVLGLPQSARRVRPDVAHGPAAAHGRAGGDQ